MEKILDSQKLIIDQFESSDFYTRTCFQGIHLENRINGIVGPRGIGKTSFLIHEVLHAGAKEMRALYLSTDSIYFVDHTLLGLIDTLYKETDIRTVCIDEIQKYAAWRPELKNIYDTYREMKIIFSGSSAIDLVQSKVDLSRRVSLYPLQGFSFREYLEFYLGLKLPVLSLNDILNHHLTICLDLNIPHLLKHFKEYLKCGYYPFFKNFSHDLEKFQAIENTALKTIYEDISAFHSIKSSTLLLIEKLYKFVLNSLPGELNAYKLAKTLGKDFESVSLYLSYLQQAGLIRFLYPKKSGHAYIRNPIKMLPENSNLLYSFCLPQLAETLTGKIRETFVINQLQNAGIDLFYSEIGDFVIDNQYFEIGGPGKTTKQLKTEKNSTVIADGVLVGSKQVIPLYLFGFLY